MAPLIATQLVPEELQRSHWYAVPRRRVGPFTVVLGQRLTLLGGTRDRRQLCVSTGTGGITTEVASDSAAARRTTGVARGLVDTQLMPDVFSTGA